jgi:hypothetical protein
MQTFDIYFLGELAPGADPVTVKREVAKLFKISESAADRLFSGQALRVKQAVDVDVAGRYRSLFRDAGALVQIVQSGDPAPEASTVQSTPPPPTPSATTEAPAGSPVAAPTAPGMTLAAPGATIDETPPPEPARIDTSRLSAQPANTGSLEDCIIAKPPQPIPDISHLDLVDD